MRYVRVIGLVAAIVAVVTAASAQNSGAAAATGQVPITSAFAHIDQSPPGGGAPRELPSERHGVVLNPDANPIMLLSVDNAVLLAEDAATPSAGPLRAGIVLEVGVSWPSEFVVQQQVPGIGRILAAAVNSPGAEAVRLRLTDVDLPAGSELWVYSLQQPERRDGPYRGSGPRQDGRFWSRTIPGETVVIEVFEPAGAATPARLTIAGALHVYRPFDGPLPGFGLRAACHNDVMCFSAYHPLHNATARLFFIDGGSGFLCTATLLATEAADETPYLLTANHCVSTNSVARTVDADWFYQTSTCDGANAAFSTSSDADVLVTNATVDMSLLMLNGGLPSGLTWAGWTSNTVNINRPVVTIHHPAGLRKKITFGTTITHPFGDPTHFYGITWTSGAILGGTSGSGLYRDNANQFLIGVASHSAGPIDCTNPDGPSGYGKFNWWYNNNASLRNLLVVGSDDAFESNDDCNQPAPLAPGTYNNLVVKSTSEDWYAIALGAGADLTVAMSHTNSFGDIDLELYDACGGGVRAFRRGSQDDKTLPFTNTGAAGDFLLRVYLDSDTRNDYSLTITVAGGGCGPACDIPGGGGDADVNDDCVVDLTDLAVVLGNFGRSGVAHADGDTDLDGDVDLSDLANVLGRFGQVCP